MSLIVDASVTLAWAAPDEDSSIANDAMLHVFENGALVPAHWSLEVSNSLLVLFRKKRIDEEFMMGMLSSLRDLQLDIDSHTMENAFQETLEIARTHNLTVYDAAYLELARRTGAALATLDRDIIAAAPALGVSIFPTPSEPKDSKPMTTDINHNDEPWNEEKAALLPGRTAMIRVVTIDPASGAELSRSHHFGIIERCDLKTGIFLRQGDGTEVAMPPFTGALQPAEAGTYTLPGTGETVTNPDFWATWVREA